MSTYPAAASRPGMPAVRAVRYALLTIITAGLFMQLIGFKLIRSRVAFTTIQTAPVEKIDLFAIAPDGSPWILYHNMAGAYEIRAPKGSIVALPSSEQLSSMQSGLQYPPDGLVVDSTGRVWISFDTALLHYEAGAWQLFEFPDGQTQHEVFDLTVAGGELWLIADLPASQHSVLKVDPGSGSSQVYGSTDIAGTPAIQPAGLRVMADGGLTALVANRGTKTIFLYGGGRWRLVAALRGGDPRKIVQDYAIAPNGDLWLLYWAVCEADRPVNPLEHFSAVTGEWQSLWPAIGGTCQAPAQFKSIQVDGQGRLWLDSVDSMEVFEVAPAEQLRHLQTYSPRNSNYQNTSFTALPSLTPNGRLWTAHRSVAWIQTGATTLPSVLPEAAIFLFEDSRGALILLAVYSLLLVVYGRLDGRR